LKARYLIGKLVMSDEILDQECSRALICSYKHERYSVRDNGSVFKHSPEGKRTRPTDNKWTFGEANAVTGYMEIASVRVHLIVATAFHGERSTKVYVVDHIDTNRRNNRPENLRWLTRLENAMSNPVTRKKIEFVCDCTVEEFLANPEKYRNRFQDQNFSWMRTVSSSEAKACLENMKAWAKSDRLPSGGTLGEWVYKPILKQQYIEPIPELVKAKTSNAVQLDWRVPSEFPLCPQEYSGEPITAYAEKMQIGLPFCVNDIYSSLVAKYTMSDDHQTLYVISESISGPKPWAVAKITFDGQLFVHASLGAFFELNGAQKRFCLAQGFEWTGGDSIDDYC
jgi:hypothetical protein